MLYETLVDTYNKLENTTKRLEMTHILSELLQKATTEEIDKIMYLTQGKLHPDWKGEPEIGMAEKMVIETIVKVSGLQKKTIEEWLKDLGDIGLVAEEAIKNKKQSIFVIKHLTVSDIFVGIDNIARYEGQGSSTRKIDALGGLLANVSPLGARYLTRMVIGKLRLGIGDMTILDALSQAYTGSRDNRKELERAYNLSSDLGSVAQTIAAQGIKGLMEYKVRLGYPIRMMSAQRLSTADEVFEKLGGRVSAEFKLDGERFQIHRNGDFVQIFSRRLENITYMYPDVVELTRNQINADTAIIEGEAVAFDRGTGEDRPFQTLMQRRRKHRIEEMMEKIPVRVYLFDCLYTDGMDLTLKPYPKRVEILEDIIDRNDQFKLVNRLVTYDPIELEHFFQEATTQGTEGLVVKSMNEDSIYRAGARSWLWVKLKRSYQSKMQDHVDLVVVGGFYGRGRRAGTYGALLAAAYDPGEDRYKTVCKVGSGLTDETLEGLPELFREFELISKPPSLDSFIDAEIWFEPVKVIEVLGDEITLSPLHTCAFNEVRKGSGLAIRFPRFTRWRKDKSAEESSTVQEILNMYKAQLKSI
jgi:DNA ligase-1